LYPFRESSLNIFEIKILIVVISIGKVISLACEVVLDSSLKLISFIVVFFHVHDGSRLTSSPFSSLPYIHLSFRSLSVIKTNVPVMSIIYADSFIPVQLLVSDVICFHVFIQVLALALTLRSDLLIIEASILVFLGLVHGHMVVLSVVIAAVKGLLTRRRELPPPDSFPLRVHSYSSFCLLGRLTSVLCAN